MAVLRDRGKSLRQNVRNLWVNAQISQADKTLHDDMAQASIGVALPLPTLTKDNFAVCKFATLNYAEENNIKTYLTSDIEEPEAAEANKNAQPKKSNSRSFCCHDSFNRGTVNPL